MTSTHPHWPTAEPRRLRRRRRRHGRAPPRRGAARPRPRRHLGRRPVLRGAARAVRPGRADLATSPGSAPEDLLLGDRDLPRTRWSPCTSAPRSPRSTPRPGPSVPPAADVTPYDALVLATGSSAFVPPVTGADLPGRVRLPHDRGRPDARGLGRRASAARRCAGPSSAAACSASRPPARCTASGVEHHRRRVRRPADAAAGRRGRRRGAAPDRRGSRRRRCAPRPRRAGAARRRRRPGRGRWSSPTAPRSTADVVVFATGVRPRDELAREAGLVDRRARRRRRRRRCATAAADVYAIGEVACIQGRTWGLVGPGYTMAEVVVDRLLGGEATFPGADTSTKLKLLGVDVARFGDAFAAGAGQPRGRLRRPGRRGLQEAGHVRRRHDPARRRPGRRRQRRTPRCGRCSAPSSAPTRTPGCCPRAACRAGRAATCPTPRTSAPATTSPPARSATRSCERRLHRPRRRSRPAPRPAPAAAPACRWSRS